MDLELPNWLGGGGWVVPVIGLGAFGMALAVGRRVLAGAPARPPRDEPVLEVRFLTGGHPERRGAPRRAGSLVVVSLSDGGAAEQRGWVLDRSIGGLGILVDGPVPVGSVLHVRATEASQTTPWVSVTVRFVKPADGRFELGCQFLRVPSWNELLQFG